MEKVGTTDRKRGDLLDVHVGHLRDDNAVTVKQLLHFLELEQMISTGAGLTCRTILPATALDGSTSPFFRYTLSRL